MPRDVNLNDFFFKYGVRLNPVLVNDLYATQIVLASGAGTDSEYNPVPWYYHPMVFSRNDHPINSNLEAIKFQFTGSLDTLQNEYKKSILYRSSPLSKIEATPKQLRLDILNTPPDKELYNNGNHPLAILIEGSFSSSFENRIKPLELEGNLEKGIENKMIVIADGDVIRNQLRNGRPLELGYDKWTNNYYGNKEFLLNSVNYLLDDTGLINIRNKKVTIPLLDPEKIVSQKTKWQLINMGAPLLFMVLMAIVFTIFRRRRYIK